MKTIQNVIKNESEQEILRVQLSIVTAESEKFIDEIEELCEKFSVENEYSFNFK